MKLKRVILDDKLNRLLYTLIGLACANNIFYLIKFNSFSISFLHILSIFALTKSFFSRNGGKTSNKLIFLIIFLYILIVNFSVLSIIFNAYQNNVDIFLKNLVVLFLGLVIFYAVIRGANYKQNVYNGLKIGLLMNAIYIIYQLIFFNNLDALLITFPVNFLFGGHSDEIRMNLFYHCRPFGFFQEPSHAAVYFNTILILTYNQFVNDNKKFKYFFITLSYILTMSSAVPLLFVGWLVLSIVNAMFVSKNSNRKKGIRLRSVATIFVIAIFIVVYSAINLSQIDDSVIFGSNDLLERGSNMIQGVSLKNINNADRFITMKAGFEIFKQHPLGIGYGLSAKVIENIIGATRIHSRLLALLIELGIVGFLFIAISAFVVFKRLITINTRESKSIAVALLIYTINISIGSGLPFDFFWVLLGLSAIIIQDNILLKKLHLNNYEEGV